ncbi:MAG: hypothetical protein JNJ91_05155 [Flavobacteriales bacterium]|nr:hypothetical protein [Flavobacteriales bacterium]
MHTSEQLKAAAAHIFDTFDDALDRLGKNETTAIELLNLLLEHATTCVDKQGRPLSITEFTWALTARKAMGENPDVIAVVTTIVERTGVIRPLAVTKDLPEHAGNTMRTAATEIMRSVCSLLFKTPFRCGCRTCESDGASELRDAIAAGRVSWTQTKAEA